MSKSLNLTILLILLILMSCKDVTMNPKDYPYVITYNPTEINETGITFEGEVFKTTQNSEVQYGFVWSTKDDPSVGDYIYSFPKGAFSGRFSKHISFDIQKGVKYCVRAYAKSESYIVYGNTFYFTGNGVLSPMIDRFYPLTGNDGVKLTVYCQNMSSKKENITFKINDKICTIDSFYNDRIVSKIPQGLFAGSYKLTIISNGSIAYSTNNFTVVHPQIVSFSPQKGNDGTTVTIIGKNFSPVAEYNTVLFDTIQAQIIRSKTDTLVVSSPKTEKSGYVTLTVRIGNLANKSSNKYQIIGPMINMVNPLAGKPNDIITVSGDLFSEILSNNKVYFGNVEAEIVGGDNKNLNVRVPDLYYGNVNISVKVNDKSVVYSKLFSVKSSWNIESVFPYEGLKDAIAFSIGANGYIGLGTSTYWGNTNEIWEYNAITRSWTEKVWFSSQRRSAVGFSIGGYGYIGTGYSNSYQEYYKDFWQYDPVRNTFIRKSDLPGNARRDAIGFCMNKKGYLGFGKGAAGYEHDFYEYDYVNDTWKKVASIDKDIAACPSFTALSKGYILVGKELWEFNSSTYTWNQKADFPGTESTGRFSVSLNNKGYVGCGRINSTTFTNEIWEYDPVTNAWKSFQSNKNLYFSNANAFSIGGVGYIGLCITGGTESNPVFTKNFWKFVPDL